MDDLPSNPESHHNPPPPHQHSAPQQPQAPPLLGTPNDNFQCQWTGCSDRAPSAEALYEHVCERHIGRKSTNNLNLQCAWGNCHIAVVKRDHITSHIRVHVPLKPHRCDFCGKAFKRPQDLKKHVKTHADDSVIIGNPGSRPSNVGGNQPNGHQNGYGNGGQNKQMITDLQALASTAAGYFPDHQQQMHGGMPMNYTHQGHNGNGATGYYAPAPPQSAYTYGNVSYANHSGDVANHASIESMKNGLDIIRSLFPDAQRGEFDPRSYAQVENRMAALQNYELPFLAPPVAQIQPINAGGGEAGYGPSQYALPPMDHLRTKNDLINLDQLFATMQSTIYENANEVAAAGVGQPGAHYVPGGVGYRSSNSPPSLQLPSSHAMSVATPRSNHSSTPALTPPSSAVSNTSGNSPPSMHLNTMSAPAPGGMYPTLPVRSDSQGYMPSTMASTSTLGNSFDHDQRRRFSGGRLQRAAPMLQERPDGGMDVSSDGASTPKNAIAPGSSSYAGSAAKIQPSRHVDFSSSNLDPALGGTPSPPSGELDEGAIKANEVWVGNIRIIEALRSWVIRRLERHEYEADGEGMDRHRKEDAKYDKDTLYPVLKSE
ncbi:MAG: hypothetical protein Q9163_004474 [Psora crenata]